MHIERKIPHGVDHSAQFGNVFGAVVAVFGEEAEDERVEVLPVGEIGAEGAGRLGRGGLMLARPAFVVSAWKGVWPVSIS